MFQKYGPTVKTSPGHPHYAAVIQKVARNLVASRNIFFLMCLVFLDEKINPGSQTCANKPCYPQTPPSFFWPTFQVIWISRLMLRGFPELHVAWSISQGGGGFSVLEECKALGSGEGRRHAGAATLFASSPHCFQLTGLYMSTDHCTFQGQVRTKNWQKIHCIMVQIRKSSQTVDLFRRQIPPVPQHNSSTFLWIIWCKPSSSSLVHCLESLSLCFYIPEQKRKI